MVMQAIFLAAVIVIMVFLLVMMWTIYGGMKEFLRDNVREVIIASGECIIDRVQNLHGAMSTHINALETGNMTLRNEITRRLDALSGIIADSGGKSETGVNSIVNELNDIIPALRDEMKNLADTLSQNTASFQTSTISNLEAEIRKLIMAVNFVRGRNKVSKRTKQSPRGNGRDCTGRNERGSRESSERVRESPC